MVFELEYFGLMQTVSLLNFVVEVDSILLTQKQVFILTRRDELKVGASGTGAASRGGRAGFDLDELCFDLRKVCGDGMVFEFLCEVGVLL